MRKNIECHSPPHSTSWFSVSFSPTHLHPSVFPHLLILVIIDAVRIFNKLSQVSFIPLSVPMYNISATLPVIYMYCSQIFMGFLSINIIYPPYFNCCFPARLIDNGLSLRVLFIKMFSNIFDICLTHPKHPLVASSQFFFTYKILV